MDADNSEQGILSFVRRSRDGEMILCVMNFRPESRERWRVGVPRGGEWTELLSSDDERFGGSGKVNRRKVHTAKIPCQGQPWSLKITVPPLGGALFRYTGETARRAGT